METQTCISSYRKPAVKCNHQSTICVGGTIVSKNKTFIMILHLVSDQRKINQSIKSTTMRKLHHDTERLVIMSMCLNISPKEHESPGWGNGRATPHAWQNRHPKIWPRKPIICTRPQRWTQSQELQSLPEFPRGGRACWRLKLEQGPLCPRCFLLLHFCWTIGPTSGNSNSVSVRMIR